MIVFNDWPKHFSPDLLLGNRSAPRRLLNSVLRTFLLLFENTLPVVGDDDFLVTRS